MEGKYPYKWRCDLLFLQNEKGAHWALGGSENRKHKYSVHQKILYIYQLKGQHCRQRESVEDTPAAQTAASCRLAQWR